MSKMNEGAWYIALYTTAICLYFSSLVLAIYIVIKFRKHRTFATGLFYCVAILAILFRMAYYFCELFW